MRLPKQFSLRTLLLLSVLAAVSLALWVADAKKQRAATKAVNDLGGRVTYKKPPHLVPPFVVNAIGHDYFCSVDVITLYPTATSDADQQIMVLKDLPELRKLAIWPGSKRLATAPIDPPGGLTDRGVDFLLTNLPNLEHLSLLSARITQDAEQDLLERTTIESLQYQTHSAFGRRSGGRQ